MLTVGLDVPLLRYPITGIAACCARAATGHAAAAPPSSEMNARRPVGNSFDQLASTDENARRNLESQGASCLHVKYQVERHRLFDGQLTRFLAS